ncbi:glycosyltransferase [Microbacter sp. GSS18]|nr:glycosyltransferase [Microbacter sp. GSS18]
MPFLLQSVVFPQERDPDLLPLYVDPDAWSKIGDEQVRVADRAGRAVVLDRRRVRVSAGTRASFGTYFNAFPASYWQHWTGVRQVTLTVSLSGPAAVLVYRSNGDGTTQRIAARDVGGESHSTFRLELDGYSDGGWIWFDVVAGEEPATLEGARWETDQAPERDGKASIGITTFNKPDYCVETLRALARSEDVRDVIDRIFLIDQGDRPVSSQPGFDAVAADLGDTLQVVVQANLGGSGGFSRAMAESLEREETAFVQLLDDDVEIEPESVRRGIVFARYTTKPAIVGGHMFDLLDRPRLHAFAEVVDELPFAWRPVHEDRMPHDFSVSNLRQSPLLHQRMDADYNGWWMCLIPTETIRAVGLAMPAFIKWDDAEYCLRAREAGFATVTLPGVALWHISWLGKDDFVDWQAYFHARNRIVAALLHSSAPRGGSLLRHSRRMDLKHLLSMQYYPVALRHRAIRDILTGPAHMHRTLRTVLPDARSLAAEFPETVLHREAGTPLRARLGRQVSEGRRGRSSLPGGWRLRWFTLSSLVRHWVRNPAHADGSLPEVEVSKTDAQWWRLPRYDSAIVSAANGSGKNVYVRDRARYRSMLVESVRLHRALSRRWPALAREYRRSLAAMTSPGAWQREFDAAD